MPEESLLILAGRERTDLSVWHSNSTVYSPDGSVCSGHGVPALFRPMINIELVVVRGRSLFALGGKIGAGACKGEMSNNLLLS